jgi:hypothetical protein
VSIPCLLLVHAQGSGPHAWTGGAAHKQEGSPVTIERVGTGVALLLGVHVAGEWLYESVLPALAPGERKEVSVKLDGLCRVECVAMNTRGAPLDGQMQLRGREARSVQRAHEPHVRQPRHSVLVPQSGRIDALVSAGTYDVLFRHGNTETRREWTATPGGRLEVIVDAPGLRTVAGRLVDANGEPLEGLHVTWPGGHSTMTGSAGTFEFQTVSPGSLTVVTHGARFTVPESDGKFVLGIGVVRGVIVDAVGRPTSAFVNMRLDDEYKQFEASAACTDALGAFEVRLPAGRWWIRPQIDRDNWSAPETLIDVPAAGIVAPVTLRLK